MRIQSDIKVMFFTSFYIFQKMASICQCSENIIIEKAQIAYLEPDHELRQEVLFWPRSGQKKLNGEGTSTTT